MKTYSGTRLYPGDAVSPTEILVMEDGRATPLRHRVRHSPTGMNWGYGGSGPADLARSILWEHLSEEPSPSVYQEFKFDFVARWGREWSITEAEIDEWLARKERAEA